MTKKIADRNRASLMTTEQAISEYLVTAINNAPRISFPFDHVVLTDIFPVATYEALLNMLPIDSYYRELIHKDAIMENGQSARLQFPLNRNNINRLPIDQRHFWNQALTGFGSKLVEDAWRTKFKEAIETVSGKPISTIKFRSHYTLFRDIGGYKITIHPDSPRKAITTQYYLPDDESQIQLGTLFHEKTPDGNYNESFAVPFVPNSGYGFAVTKSSYHSVKPMIPEDKPRNSLMVIINYDRGPLIEAFKSGRTHLRAWYDQVFGMTANDLLNLR
jgi:hypothetical protein